MFTPNINNENASYWVRFFNYSHLLITFEEKSIMGKTITITEDQLRKIVEVEVRFALAKAKFPIDGFSIVKHAVGSTDDSRNWSKYWEENHESHHFPSEPHICPSCLLLKDNFVGGHIVCKGITYIIPVCDTCNKEYKCSKAEEHPFYIKNEDMVRAPED